jgi:hypothetical protein
MQAAERKSAVPPLGSLPDFRHELSIVIGPVILSVTTTAVVCESAFHVMHAVWILCCCVGTIWWWCQLQCSLHPETAC